MRRTLRCAAAATAAAILLALPAAASATAPAITLGFTDINTLERGNPLEWPLELQHLKSARASTVRIMWQWSDIEKVKPPDAATAEDPAYAGYDFTRLDALLRAVAAAGVQPLVMVHRAPAWWEGPNRPAVSAAAPAGTWMPDPVAFGHVMAAMAKRYSGTYPDPLQPGQSLPHVALWQLWNEPNISVELNPQWTKPGGRWTATSPELYRALLANGYDAIKRIAPQDTVVTAGTAPFGEPWPGGPRIQPARFLRALLCVSGRAKLKAYNCRAKPAKFDVLAHHPYPIGPPGRTAINADDVVVPDFKKLTAPLKVALRAGNVYPKTKSKPVWATEMSWDTNPPDPGGIPAALQAQYTAGAIYVLWRQDVKRLYWWNVRDDAKGAGYDTTLQSGVFYRGATVSADTPKPSFTAFRFPFVAYRAYANFRGHGLARLWGMAPHPGLVVIQRRAGSAWKPVARVRARADRSFGLRVRASRGTRLRALQDGEPSIDAKVF